MPQPLTPPQQSSLGVGVGVGWEDFWKWELKSQFGCDSVNAELCRPPMKHGSQQLHADQRADENTDLAAPGRAAKLKVCLPAVSPCSPCARWTWFGFHSATPPFFSSFFFFFFYYYRHVTVTRPCCNLPTQLAELSLASKLFTFLLRVWTEGASFSRFSRLTLKTSSINEQ